MTAKNRVKVWTLPDLHDAELLSGVYETHSYPWHAHEEFSIGLVLSGAVYLQTRRQEGIATAGSFVLINSEELHRGSQTSGEGWTCRTLHLSTEGLRTIGEGVLSGNYDTPRFDGPTFVDEDLAASFLHLHQIAETTGSALDRQSRIVAIIAKMLFRHSVGAAACQIVNTEQNGVRRARLYLDEHLGDKVTLDDLALEAGLPPFRLLRAFRNSIGLTPHMYQLQARVRRALSLIKRGERLADVSSFVGFSDQAHLTRVFKGIMGATPGQYKAAIFGAR